MVQIDVRGTAKIAHRLEKYENGRTPDDGAPDDVIEWADYIEADGSPITDPDRIAAIDAAQKEQQG